MARTSGIWATYAYQPPVVPVQAPIDPEHLTPSDALPGGMTASWASTVVAPVLPDAVDGQVPGVVAVPGGPVDETPQDPNFGVGVGPGLTLEENQAIRTALMSDDRGAVAAHQWVPNTDRDGTWHVARIVDSQPDGDSPQTLQLERTGVGQPNDPYARKGTAREKRWVDRVIDMHWWNPEYRPATVKNAITAQPASPVQSGGPLVSPFPANTGTPGTPDSFVAPQERRTPQPWDTLMTTDGTASLLSPDGLSSWGL